MTVAVVQFPGSNCDRDCINVLQNVVGAPVEKVWHHQTELPPSTRAVLIPGGFSFGDYLRPGAIASVKPILSAIKSFAQKGGPVLGICNGFQILCEAGLLPGVLLPNDHGRFVCQIEELEVATTTSSLLAGYQAKQRIKLPIAHRDGNYFADQATIAELEAEDRIAFRYVLTKPDGQAQVNGSAHAIAGVIGGPKRNILGLMPHPERRAEDRLGGTDGLAMLRSLAHA